MNMNHHSILASMALGAALIVTACSRDAGKAAAGHQAAAQSIPVHTAPVVHQTTTDVEPITAAGLVASELEARLSFKTGGIIRTIDVREGERVRKGQLLATLDLTEINAQVGQAQEALAKAERDMHRVRNLYRDSVATLEQMQNATTAYEVAQRTLEIARYNRSFSEIRATNDGVILRKLSNEGELTAPGTPVLVLNGTGPQNWKIIVSVPDKDWARLRAGDRAAVTLDAFPGRTFGATITTVGQGADPRSGLYQVELRLTDAPRELAAGLFARATITPATGQASAMALVPIDAIIEGNGSQAFVFAADNGKARRVSVRIDRIRTNDVSITGPLDGVTSVITGGSAYVTDGATIHVVR